MPVPKQIITILTAEDHPLTLAGLCSILEQAPDMKVVGKTGDGSRVKQLVAKLRPDILLLDLKMPGLSPAEVECWVRENYPDTITLVLTAHDRDAYLAGMMEAGAAGYLHKSLCAEQLVSAIRRAARGESLFNMGQIERARHWREEVLCKWENLSDRQREILQLLAAGGSNAVMAASLGIQIHTLEKHLTSIYQKLGVSSRAEAILWWLENGGVFRY